LSAPYKTPTFLQRVISDEIGLILICQIDEIDEIAEAITSPYIQKVGIRLRSPRPNKQIGVSGDKDTISKITEKLNKNNNLSLTTLQLHSGTQLDDQLFKEGITYLLDTANMFEQQGFSISQLDFGGGFPEASNLSEDDLTDLFLLLYETLHDRGWQHVTCIFEPGRYIVGDAGLVLTQIIRVFKVEGIPWIMLDTGTHQCPKFSNSKFRFELIHRMSDPHTTPTSIAGCLPTDMDVFTKRYPFPSPVDKGEYLAILNAGAYTLTWSTRFSYPFPSILLVNGNRIQLLEVPQI